MMHLLQKHPLKVPDNYGSIEASLGKLVFEAKDLFRISMVSAVSIGVLVPIDEQSVAYLWPICH